MTGSRRDVVAYVCERPGEYTVPAARLTWWDLAAKRLRTIDFPARTIAVAAAAAPGAATPAPTAAGWPSTRTAVGIGVVIAVLAASWFAAVRLHAGRVLSRIAARCGPVHLQPLNPSPAGHGADVRGGSPGRHARFGGSRLQPETR